VANALASLLSTIPPALWNIPSLVSHLLFLYYQNPSSVEDEEDSISIGNPKIEASPVCLLFYRSVEAVCAWNTGMRYLISSTIAQHQIPVHLSMLDLPREPLTAHSSEALLERWNSKAREANWSDSLLSRFKQKMREKIRTHNHSRSREALAIRVVQGGLAIPIASYDCYGVD